MDGQTSSGGSDLFVKAVDTLNGTGIWTTLYGNSGNQERGIDIAFVEPPKNRTGIYILLYIYSIYIPPFPFSFPSRIIGQKVLLIRQYIISNYYVYIYYII